MQYSYNVVHLSRRASVVPNGAPTFCTKWKWRFCMDDILIAQKQHTQHTAHNRLKCVISMPFVCRVCKVSIVARSHTDTAFYLFSRNALGTLLHSKYEVFSREVCDLGHGWCVKQYKTLPGVSAVLVWLCAGRKFSSNEKQPSHPPNKRLCDLTMEAIMMIMMMRVTMTTLARCAEHRA